MGYAFRLASPDVVGSGTGALKEFRVCSCECFSIEYVT